jgi:hypothetical protein
MPHVSYDVSFNATVLKNVRSTGYNDSAQIIMDRASGSPDPSAIYMGNSEPIVNLQTTDLATLVGLNSNTFVSSGLCVKEQSTTIPVAKRADCASLAAGGSHVTFVGNDVIVIPTQFEARQDSEEGATATVEVRFRSADGITAPITMSKTATLSAASYAVPYGLAAAFVDDTNVDNLIGIVVNPGITLVLQRHGGGIFPRKHFIQFRDPTIDLIVEDAEVAEAFINRYGTGNVGVRAFFRKKKDGSAYEADNAEAHIRFSFASALSKMETLEAAQSGNGSTTIRCYGKALVATSAVAIA